MVKVHPFSALRFNSELPINSLIAPPYDVIPKEEREKYLGMHPYNITHLTLGDSLPVNYEEIKELFLKWIDSQVLITESPGFYLYKQEFQWGDRYEYNYGLIALLELEPLGENILPHEHTFSGPKLDRLELLRKLRANLEPIWGIYEDKDSILRSIWREVEKEKPIIKAHGWDYRIHTVWKLDKDNYVNLIENFFLDKKVLIADGHHRYEASWLYYEESKDPNAKYIMMLMTDLYDPGIKLLPTHRVLKNNIGIELNAFRKYFDLYLEDNKIENLDLSFKPNNPYIYYAVDNKLFKLVPKADYINENKEHSELWWILPTTILHKGVWEGILGKTENELQEKGVIRFSHDIKEVKSLLYSSDYKSAFVLPSIPIEIVYTLAVNRERLPQKSTYFYPKPVSGLIIWRMNG
ncbi:DUF1015 family protein [Dictyoglomus thermophilum]|uniref:DUF1015 domain-containing protein n=1 Tax=Dictyoglomus thermophilum (strain ATCC 35947 / DSM 3960 / H-6-12) TaxID=309799 RepID=B5YEK1_DICT6|nr:DUF1015 domain-containing protein [Dictyoglomus thermophilum]ACI19099.1 conserved hypothetical protein [Dictyoglomus thermophilum H-6-12]